MVLALLVLSCSQTAQAIIIGDFDSDGDIDGIDADLWCGAVAAGTTLLDFDLTGDSLVDPMDFESWFALYSTHSGVPLSIALVDVNFDAVNTITDYQIIQSNFGS